MATKNGSFSDPQNLAVAGPKNLGGEPRGAQFSEPGGAPRGANFRSVGGFQIGHRGAPILGIRGGPFSRPKGAALAANSKAKFLARFV